VENFMGETPESAVRKVHAVVGQGTSKQMMSGPYERDPECFWRHYESIRFKTHRAKN
jgi:hypothetical protein